MSAVAIAVNEDGIITACDGVCYGYETGNVEGYVSKLILMPEYSCFIAATGMGAFGAALRWEVNQGINNFDDFVERFEGLAHDVHSRLCFTHYHSFNSSETDMSCVIGGWSDRRQAFEAYRLVSYRKPSVDTDGVTRELEPFHAEPLPGAIWCSHAPVHAEEFGIASPTSDMETTDVLARMICACRAGSGFVESEDDDRHYNVGGFLQMAVIQRDYVQSWIAHRWPEDEIGKPIDPSKGERIVGWQMKEAA